jgi:SHS2 domain-containing protein
MAVPAHYELYDHTADVGIRVFAPTLPALLKPASDGLYSVIGELVARDDAVVLNLDFTAAERPGADLLLRDYLAELLLVFERDQRIVTQVDVRRFDERKLALTATAALLDEGRTIFHREVKAVTYHELEVRRTPDGYEATFILDI